MRYGVDAPRSKCVVTGKPARYRDPATGLPYYDLAAFQVLRQRAAKQQARNPAASPIDDDDDDDADMSTGSDSRNAGVVVADDDE